MKRHLRCSSFAAVVWAGAPAAMAQPADAPAAAAESWVPDWRAWFGPRERPGPVALQTAVARGDGSEVRRMLEEGADPNGTADASATPLQVAILNGRGDLAQMLLERGANPALTARDSPIPRCSWPCAGAMNRWPAAAGTWGAGGGATPGSSQRPSPSWATHRCTRLRRRATPS
jgi:hypothetical protein